MDSYYYSAECHDRLVNQCPNATFYNANLLVNWIRLIKSEDEIKFSASLINNLASLELTILV